LGIGCARHRWWVIGAWLLALVALALPSAGANKPFRDVFTIPGTGSQHAVDLLQSKFPLQNQPTANVVISSKSGAISPATVQRAGATLRRLPVVDSVATPRISPDGSTALFTVSYSKPDSDLPRNAVTKLRAATAFASREGATVAFGGPVVDVVSQQSQANDHADEIGLLFAVIILLLVFGTVVAAALPLGTALTGVALATALLTLLATFLTVGTVAPILGTMIGLGVGIDYSLLIVTRFRQNRVEGLAVDEATGVAIATAGSAALFAGCCVAIALCGLWLAQIPYVSTLGFSAALFVGVMVLAALTLLPALLGVLGPHIDRLRVLPKREERDPTRGFWYRWANTVARRAWWCVIASVVVLLVLTAPLLRMRLGFTTDADDPPGYTQHTAYDLIGREFGVGANGPLLLAMSLPGESNGHGAADATAPTQALLRDISTTPGVEIVTPALTNKSSTAAVALVVPKTAPNASATQALIRRLRGDVIPRATQDTVLSGRVLVGGQTAELVDLTDRIDARLPWCIGAVILGAFLLLMMVFRSILVPLKAAIMNLFSIGAAYGVIVAVFQWGWGKGLIGLQQTVPIVAFVPLMMFAVLFGLSMDYEVFLLSRIREEYLASGDNRAAVAAGLAKTARVITSAALIMIAVFLSFVGSPLATVKMIGLGLAVAVAVDATVVRIVLVPATMELLGDANWWFPHRLDRLLPHIEVEPAPTAVRSGSVPA
jgi:RND superfamily putative drug exporter